MNGALHWFVCAPKALLIRSPICRQVCFSRISCFQMQRSFFLNSVASLRAAEGLLIVPPSEYCQVSPRIRGWAVAGHGFTIAPIFCSVISVARLMNPVFATPLVGPSRSGTAEGRRSHRPSPWSRRGPLHCSAGACAACGRPASGLKVKDCGPPAGALRAESKQDVLWTYLP